MHCNNCRVMFQDKQEVFVKDVHHCCSQKCCKEFEEKKKKQRSMFQPGGWKKAVFKEVSVAVTECKVLNVGMALKDGPTIQVKLELPPNTSVDSLKNFSGSLVSVDIRNEQLVPVSKPKAKDEAADVPSVETVEGRLHRVLNIDDDSARIWVGAALDGMTDDNLKEALMNFFGPEECNIVLDKGKYMCKVSGFKTPKFWPDAEEGEKPIQGKKLLALVRDVMHIRRPEESLAA